jgi:hypothetical protein
MICFQLKYSRTVITGLTFFFASEREGGGKKNERKGHHRKGKTKLEKREWQEKKEGCTPLFL